MVRILFGVIDDAPGIVIGPDGKPHRMPGGPGDPGPVFRIAEPIRDVLLGQLLHDLGAVATHTETQKTLTELGAKLVKSAGAR